MSINLSKINYNYGTITFVTTGAAIKDQQSNGIIDVDDLVKEYNNIFTKGNKYSEEIKKKLEGIVGTNDINATDFYTDAKTINNKTIDSNCLEGYRAYSFYLEKIVSLLNKIDNAVVQGQEAINAIKTLTKDNVPANQTVDEYVNDKVHALSSQLYLADKAIADAMDEFESCLKYNADTKSWDTSSYSNSQLNGISRETKTKENKITIEKLKIGNNALTLAQLREWKVEITDAGNNNATHEITCFSELNLMDRLRYIRYYYELILCTKQDTNYQVFPDDSETGYPCIPDIESTTDTKATESMGGFELFYVGYLVDRDGSIDAYSSCLEAKSTAITNNISLQSKHIEAYNQYLTFINRASQLLNESQSGGTAAIPHGAHLGLTYFCGGTMRDLLEVNGVDYIVLSYTDGSGSKDYYKDNSDFNYGFNDRYLLVRADEDGLKALYNTDSKENGKLDVITTGDLAGLFEGSGTEGDCDFTISLENKYTPPGFEGTTFYRRACRTYEDKNNDRYPILVSSSAEKNEILIWECSEDKAKKYLPKEITAQAIEPESVAEYDRYAKYSKDGWGYDGDNPDAEEANRVINSWTTAFSNKSEYINTAIETINTDITSLRTKMDTIDSLCSTLRNRSFETKKQLVSNIRS